MDVFHLYFLDVLYFRRRMTTREPELKKPEVLDARTRLRSRPCVDSFQVLRYSFGPLS